MRIRIWWDLAPLAGLGNLFGDKGIGTADAGGQEVTHPRIGHSLRRRGGDRIASARFIAARLGISSRNSKTEPGQPCDSKSGHGSAIGEIRLASKQVIGE